MGLHYDPVTITLHWISVVLIGLLWAIGQTIDFAPSGTLRSITDRCTSS
jgi:cytochrome b561